MKTKDIKEYEIGEHCFGEILSVDGKDYEDLEQYEILEFIIDMFKNDINSGRLVRETFKNCLEYLQFDCEETNSSPCGQCGNFNTYTKYKAPVFE